MKQLKFNEKRILKSLLDKTKTTTIRKAWEEKTLDKDYKCNECGMKGTLSGIYDKPCKYKVGEIVEVVWTGKIEWNNSLKEIQKILKNKEKNKIYACNECGKGSEVLLYTGEQLTKKGKCPRNHKHKLYEVKLNIKKKPPFEVDYECYPILGKAKITKIEKIEIGKERMMNVYFIRYLEDGMYCAHNKLSKSGGFKNPKEMFSYLEEYARGLKEAKPFWLISWNWEE